MTTRPAIRGRGGLQRSQRRRHRERSGPQRPLPRAPGGHQPGGDGNRSRPDVHHRQRPRPARTGARQQRTSPRQRPGVHQIPRPPSHRRPLRPTRLTKGQGFIPLTEARQVPTGSQIDARQGTISPPPPPPNTAKPKPAPSPPASSNSPNKPRHPQRPHHPLPPRRRLPRRPQLPTSRPRPPHPHRPHRPPQPPHPQHPPLPRQPRQFRTKGRYSAGTVRGTQWDTTDRCDGTLTKVKRGTVQVKDFHRHKTILVHAHHSYLARAFKKRR